MLLEINHLNDWEIQLIEEFANSDPASVALTLHGKPDIDGKKISQQILSRQKARAKLPEWHQRRDLIFPPPVSVEQASSQATAAYKASLVSGTHLIDLTLGMGVDSYFFSRKFQKVTGYEINPELADLTRYNLGLLGASNVEVISGNGENAASENTDHVFADPSRRDHQKKKIVAFEDSSPNVLTLLPRFLKKGIKVIIKSSPLIDISAAIKQLGPVSEVHVVGYQKECKEIVFIIDPAHSAPNPKISAVLINQDGAVTHRQDFTIPEEQSVALTYGPPEGYLYEPHPAFLKAGGFNLLATAYGLNKIAKNSHLYYSPEIRTDFPGRLFKINGVENASSFSWKKWLKEGKANLTIRNFPASPDDLRKKWRLKEGGQDYLFATTLSSNSKVVIVTEKTNS